ncbi:porin [Cereibacter changlensis]|nr:porin [Cereibacter changlensis]PZX58668.1 outer membrane protein OmpU [Cereibacter changlensis]
MKKILLATTALAFSAGFAAAEVSFSGQAKMGLKYDGALEDDKATAHSEAVLYVAMSGETDTGLAFGATIDMIVENNGDLANDDTTVFISGAFGKLSMGAVPEAEELGGLSDIGWDDLGSDDIAENITGDELDDYMASSLDHNVNYTYAADAFSISISGKIDNANTSDGDDVESYAIGGRYNFGDAYVGLGYAKHSNLDFDGAATDGPFDGDAEVATIAAGGTFGAFGIAALYADGKIDNNDTGADYDVKSYGLRGTYSMDAFTFVAAYSKADMEDFADDQEIYGLAAAYDLGGGASLAGGIARSKAADADRETVADFGITMSF